MGTSLKRGGERPVPGAVTSQVLDQVARTGEPVIAVWQPNRQVSFGPRDRHQSGYAHAVEAARTQGFPAVERDMGGRPVALHEDCIAMVYGVPPHETIEIRYRVVVDTVEQALSAWGVHVEQAAAPASFCPGQRSLIGAGKVAGFAQRVRADAAAVGGLVIVRNHEAVIDVLEPVYDLLELPFEAATVGSLARSGIDRPTAELTAELEGRFVELAESMAGG